MSFLLTRLMLGCLLQHFCSNYFSTNTKAADYTALLRNAVKQMYCQSIHKCLCKSYAFQRSSDTCYFLHLHYKYNYSTKKAENKFLK